MTSWNPCGDCKARLGQMESSKQTHIAGLTRLEVVSRTEDFAGKGSWSQLSKYRCEM